MISMIGGGEIMENEWKGYVKMDIHKDATRRKDLMIEDGVKIWFKWESQ